MYQVIFPMTQYFKEPMLKKMIMYFILNMIKYLHTQTKIPLQLITVLSFLTTCFNLSSKPFEIDNILFKDVVLHCTQLCEEDVFTVLSLLFINGGTFEKDLNDERVTHLICKAASGVSKTRVSSFLLVLTLKIPSLYLQLHDFKIQKLKLSLNMKKSLTFVTIKY